MQMPNTLFIATDNINLAASIRETANQLGIEFRFFDNNYELISNCHDHCPHLIIIDLNYKIINPLETIITLKSDNELDEIRIIGIGEYCPECNEVLTIGELGRLLPGLIQDYLHKPRFSETYY